jgi:hypothetical protein
VSEVDYILELLQRLIVELELGYSQTDIYLASESLLAINRAYIYLDSKGIKLPDSVIEFSKKQGFSCDGTANSPEGPA